MIKKVHFESKKEVPLGVKIISIIHYIFVAMFGLPGLFMIVSSKNVMSSLISTTPQFQGVLTSGIIILVGLILLGFSIFALIVGINLWKLRKWTRILVIIFSILWIIYLIISMIIAFSFIQILWIIISIFMGVYLLFSKEAKDNFK